MRQVWMINEILTFLCVKNRKGSWQRFRIEVHGSLEFGTKHLSGNVQPS